MTDLSALALQFCRLCLKQTDAHVLNGSSLIYSREGRLNPHDLNQVMEAVAIWCRRNNRHFSITYNAHWEVVISGGDVASHANSPYEALMDACIVAQKLMEVA